MTAEAEAADVHASELVTVKEYVPEDNPEKSAVVPEVFKVCPPGDAVIVHVPEGNPLNETLPVETEHVGWVIDPTIGAVGVTG